MLGLLFEIQYTKQPPCSLYSARNSTFAVGFGSTQIPSCQYNAVRIKRTTCGGFGAVVDIVVDVVVDAMGVKIVEGSVA